MTARRKLSRWLVYIVAIHAVIVLAGFFAPYSASDQDRERPYLPPMRVHFIDASGHFHLRPFCYPLQLKTGSFDQFEENSTTRVPLTFVTSGARYRLLGVIPMRLHFFGTANTETRLYLFGTDAFGRDQLSRILVGGQVSLFAGLVGTGITLTLAALIGLCSGFFGGWRDNILMRLAELFLALPWLYLL